MIRATVIVLMLLFAAAPAMAAALHADFKDFHTTSDGKVTFEDFKEHFPKATMDDFRSVDTGGNGAFTREEWDAYMKKAGMQDHDAQKGHGPSHGK